MIYWTPAGIQIRTIIRLQKQTIPNPKKRDSIIAKDWVVIRNTLPIMLSRVIHMFCSGCSVFAISGNERSRIAAAAIEMKKQIIETVANIFARKEIGTCSAITSVPIIETAPVSKVISHFDQLAISRKPSRALELSFIIDLRYRFVFTILEGRNQVDFTVCPFQYSSKASYSQNLRV